MPNYKTTHPVTGLEMVIELTPAEWAARKEFHADSKYREELLTNTQADITEVVDGRNSVLLPRKQKTEAA